MRGSEMRWGYGARFAFAAVVGLGASAAWAASDYSDKDFSVRLPSAFVRFTEVATSGGESVANRYSSAVNPASAGWLEVPTPLGVGLIAAPYYSHIYFNQGTRLNLTAESATWDTKDLGLGVIQLNVTQIRSNRETTRQGLLFDYEVDDFLIQWAKRFGPVGVGASFDYARTDIAETATLPMLGRIKVLDAESESYRFRVGGLYEPAERWLVGLIVEYGWAPASANVVAFVPPYMTPVHLRVHDTEHQYIVRPGVSYAYQEFPEDKTASVAYLDYQLGVFETDTDILHSSRFSFGVDQRVLRWLFVRLGPSVDTRGNVGFAAGIGAYFSEHVAVDVGYQYNMLPELQPEFGPAQIFQVAVSVRI